MEDIANHFFLHLSDGLDLVLVSQPLTESNYNTWSRAVLVALSMKNKVPFVDGSLPRPEEDNPQLNSWIRSNNVVISWIFNAVSKDITTSMYSDTTSEIWKNLTERFQQKNDPRIFQLRHDFMSLTQRTYYTKLNSRQFGKN